MTISLHLFIFIVDSHVVLFVVLDMAISSRSAAVCCVVFVGQMEIQISSSTFTTRSGTRGGEASEDWFLPSLL